MENRDEELIKWLLFIAAPNSHERRKIADGDPLLLELDDWIHNFVNSEKFKNLAKSYYEEDIKRLLKEGASYDVICRLTCLSVEDIKEFEKQIED